MENEEFVRQGRKITDLASKYERIVLDTSALEATKASPALQLEYRRDLRNATNEHRNIVTLDEAFTEARYVGLNKPESAGIRKINPGEYKPFFDKFDLYVRRRAKLDGILDKDQRAMQADFNFAKLVFSMSAKELQRLVFASSDRSLLDFISSTESRIRATPIGALPQLQGRIILYTFVQRLARFLPYSTERGFRNSKKKNQQKIKIS